MAICRPWTCWAPMAAMRACRSTCCWPTWASPRAWGRLPTGAWPWSASSSPWTRPRSPSASPASTPWATSTATPANASASCAAFTRRRWPPSPRPSARRATSCPWNTPPAASACRPGWAWLAPPAEPLHCAAPTIQAHMNSIGNTHNEALAPLPAGQRVFRWHDHASLWFSLGVGLLVMQVGAYLVPALGTQQALAAIVAGSLIGAGLLGWVAKIGCDSGLASAGLMHACYGRRFAGLPIVLNIVQLVGWGTFELVVMRDASVAIGRQSGVMAGGWWPVAATLLWGGVVALLISGSMVRLVRRIIARVALPLVVLSLLWLSWQFLAMAQAQGLAQVWQRRGEGGMGVMPALDLVIAMPISWLPLVADYARHGVSGAGALRGSWIGYALANIWCYALGVLVALVLPSQDLVTALLLAQGG